MGTHVRERESHAPGRRRALCLGAALIAVPSAVVALATPDDPIYAMISEHRRLAADVRACDTEIDGEDRLAELVDTANIELSRLLTTSPTTLDGLLAWARYIRHDADRGELSWAYHEPMGCVNEEDLFLDALISALASLNQGVLA